MEYQVAVTQMMSRAEWIEVLAIVIIAPASWVAWPCLPAPTPLWLVVLCVSAWLLLQSLARDVAILVRSRRAPTPEPGREAQCFCLESTVGLTGVIAGAVLVGLGCSTRVNISHVAFSLAVTATMALCFGIKDLVITWNPLGLRRDQDHLNLIVRWKSKAK
jgi:hypothetical protein